MIKTYKYRIYPTKKQTQILEHNLELCNQLYNHLLEERINTYKETGKSISKYDQQKKLTVFKKLFPEFQEIYSHILLDVTDRVDYAFKGFFRRVKTGKEKPGFPRFKSEDRYHSFTYWETDGWKLAENRIKLSKIGSIKCKLHKPFQGKGKSLIVKRTPSNKWFIYIPSEVPLPTPLPKTNKQIGIDVGCESFLTTSEGNKIENPRFFKHSQELLKKRKQKLLWKKKGSNRRKKVNVLVAKVHEHIDNQRRDFHFKVAKKLVTQFDMICVEDLTHWIAEWRSLRKSISDVAWFQFFSILTFKAEEAGRKVVRVDPKNTSQRCSGCGVIVPKELGDRIHNCPHCNLVLDRDHNAALNILQAGLACRNVNALPKS